ncbi:MAG: S9 family peptidase [Flavobacteriales bacterium]|nr:MAG: S9 family peptidase [Flavobacteriales bacterium]
MRIHNFPRKSVFFLFFISTLSLIAQEKRSLTHDDYAQWRTLSGTVFSDSGKYISWQVNPQKGDGNAFISSLPSRKSQQIPRGERVVFLPGEGYALVVQKVEEEARRTAIRDKASADKKPKPSLILLDLRTFEQRIFEQFKDLKSAEYSTPTFAFRVSGDGISASEESDSGESEDCDKTPDAEEKRKKKQPKEAAMLYVYNPNMMDSVKELGYAEKYSVSAHGDAIFFSRYNAESERYDLVYFDLAQNREIVLLENQKAVSSLLVSPHGTRALAVSTSDTLDVDESEYFFHAFRVTPKTKKGFKVLQTESKIEGKVVSPHSTLQLNDEASYIYFGLKPDDWQVYKRDTLLLDEDIARLDVWTPFDIELQSRQKERASHWKKYHHKVVYRVRKDDFTVLEGDIFTSYTLPIKSRHHWVLIQKNRDYAEGRIFTFGRLYDYEAYDLENKITVPIASEIAYSVRISPAGGFAYWYNEDKRVWEARKLISGSSVVTLASDVKIDWHNINSDIPNTNPPHGAAGVTSDDSFIWLYDEFDIWQVDPNGRSASERLTRGRENKTRYRYLRPNDYQLSIDVSEKTQYLSGFHTFTRSHSLWQYREGNASVLRTFPGDFFGFQKARYSDAFVYRSGTFSTYPNLYLLQLANTTDRVLNKPINPQQEKIYWGSVSFVDYVVNGDSLRGLLYQPENQKEGKAPLLVYFYERSADQFHRHVIPTPSRSIINYPYFLSKGYAIFVPDIAYRDGEPGKSAYDCIMTGVDSVLSQNHSWIDSTRMGLNGQSWGGYQSAWLITQTNRFKAAFSGAPVSNMTSAYGGIRWKGGYSRIMQYEQGQSRLGVPMHENLDLYIKNSPVFFTSQIETPLLIMHNDNDGAVPWYQGIEMYMSMIRQGKPVWMLVYNNEEHNLTKWANRMDLSVRMAEFYDHYLMNAEKPSWMSQGVPIWQKKTK